MLSLNPDLRRDPPSGRMVKEEDLYASLNAIYEEVLSPDMRQLMSDDRIDYAWGDSHDCGDRPQDDRPNPTDYDR
jgi:hypothetical protein